MCVVTSLSASLVILTLRGNWYAPFLMVRTVLLCIGDTSLLFILDEPVLVFFLVFIVLFCESLPSYWSSSSSTQVRVLTTNVFPRWIFLWMKWSGFKIRGLLLKMCQQSWNLSSVHMRMDSRSDFLVWRHSSFWLRRPASLQLNKSDCPSRSWCIGSAYFSACLNHCFLFQYAAFWCLCCGVQENGYWLDRLLRAYQSRAYTGDLIYSMQVTIILFFHVFSWLKVHENILHHVIVSVRRQ